MIYYGSFPGKSSNCLSGEVGPQARVGCQADIPPLEGNMAQPHRATLGTAQAALQTCRCGDEGSQDVSITHWLPLGHVSPQALPGFLKELPKGAQQCEGLFVSLLRKLRCWLLGAVGGAELSCPDPCSRFKVLTLPL